MVRREGGVVVDVGMDGLLGVDEVVEEVEDWERIWSLRGAFLGVVVLLFAASAAAKRVAVSVAQR